MKSVLPSFFILIAATTAASAGPCEERFSQLLLTGNVGQGPVRILINQEIVGGAKTVNYHYGDGNNNGMTEMVDPVDMPWSLFLGDKMYSSSDKGKSWSFVNSYDAEKARAEMQAALTSDAAEATGVLCGEESVDGVNYEVVEGSYKSSMSAGAGISQKYWINKNSGWITKTFMHIKMTGFESMSTQVIEPWPDLVLPEPK